LRTIAIDTPGYGLSARLDAPPTIADYAVAIDAVLAHLRVRRAIVVGHHTGSSTRGGGGRDSEARHHQACDQGQRKL